MDDLQFVVSEFYRLVNAREYERVVGLFHEDVTWKIPGPASIPYAGVFEGKAGVRRFFELLEEHENLESFVADHVLVDSRAGVVCALGHETAVAKPTGRRFETSWAEVFRIENGLIVAFEEHIDTHVLAAAYSSS